MKSLSSITPFTNGGVVVKKGYVKYPSEEYFVNTDNEKFSPKYQGAMMRFKSGPYLELLETLKDPKAKPDLLMLEFAIKKLEDFLYLCEVATPWQCQMLKKAWPTQDAFFIAGRLAALISTVSLLHPKLLSVWKSIVSYIDGPELPNPLFLDIKPSAEITKGKRKRKATNFYTNITSKNNDLAKLYDALCKHFASWAVTSDGSRLMKKVLQNAIEVSEYENLLEITFKKNVGNKESACQVIFGQGLQKDIKIKVPANEEFKSAFAKVVRLHNEITIDGGPPSGIWFGGCNNSGKLRGSMPVKELGGDSGTQIGFCDIYQDWLYYDFRNENPVIYFATHESSISDAQPFVAANNRTPGEFIFELINQKLSQF